MGKNELNYDAKMITYFYVSKTTGGLFRMYLSGDDNKWENARLIEVQDYEVIKDITGEKRENREELSKFCHPDWVYDSTEWLFLDKDDRLLFSHIISFIIDYLNSNT